MLALWIVDTQGTPNYSWWFLDAQGAGAVAQLGERLNGIQEVRGSIPLASISGGLSGAPDAPKAESAVGTQAVW